MTKFTRDAVSEALHAAVAAKGENYVYPKDEYDGCVYSARDGGKIYPACIVGHVVAALDPELFQNWAEYEVESNESFTVSEGAARDYPYEYKQYEDEHGYWVCDGDPQRVRKALDVDDNVTIDALASAQAIQDSSLPWKLSQEAFDRILAGEDREAVENENLLRK